MFADGNALHNTIQRALLYGCKTCYWKNVPCRNTVALVSFSQTFFSIIGQQSTHVFPKRLYLATHLRCHSLQLWIFGICCRFASFCVHDYQFTPFKCGVMFDGIYQLCSLLDLLIHICFSQCSYLSAMGEVKWFFKIIVHSKHVLLLIAAGLFSLFLSKI